MFLVMKLIIKVPLDIESVEKRIIGVLGVT